MANWLKTIAQELKAAIAGGIAKARIVRTNAVAVTANSSMSAIRKGANGVAQAKGSALNA